MEVILALHVQGTYLWTAGEFTVNCYESTKSRIEDKYYYTCDERINDMLMLEFGNKFYPLLGCQDSTMRLIDPTGKLQYMNTFSSPVSCIASADRTKRDAPLVCFGLKNGTIGAVECTVGEDEAVILWEIEPELGSIQNSPVSILKLVTFPSGNHLVVARDNGSLEIYYYDEKQCYDMVY